MHEQKNITDALLKFVVEPAKSLFKKSPVLTGHDGILD